MGEERTQIALCATLDDEIKNKTEKALLKARISYLMKCERQKEKNAENANEKKVVFYIEQHQKERALEAIQKVKEEYAEFEILY